jgi:hypothetical protein
MGEEDGAQLQKIAKMNELKDLEMSKENLENFLRRK